MDIIKVHKHQHLLYLCGTGDLAASDCLDIYPAICLEIVPRPFDLSLQSQICHLQANNDLFIISTVMDPIIA